ncbi:MAG: phospholipase C, phosphocholine-specific [Ginsengibacter sp.]
MDTRREFLKKSSLLAGGATLWNSLPASIQRAIAINPEAGSTFEDAEHIVFLMQENRSFDHCFGTLQGVRGFNDPRTISLPGNDPVWLQSNEEGKKYVPFRLNIKDTKATWMGGLPHSWDNQTDARNNGKYDKWLEAKRPGNKAYKDMPLTMGHYTRGDIPFYYALADAFTVCDQTFCSSLTGTTTNRTFFWTGKIRSKPGAQADVRNSDLYYNREASYKTFPERLEENGLLWRVYQNELSVQTDLNDDADNWLSNFTDNNLEWFSQYNVRFHKAHIDFLKKRLEELPGEINALQNDPKKANKNHAKKIEKKIDQKQQQLEKYKIELETWSGENFEKLSEYEKNLHKNAFTTNVNDPDFHSMEMFSYDDNGTERNILLPKGDVLHQFREDVNNGKLPTVSWLVAPQYFSDHPSAPWFGAWYVSEVLDILTKNPEVWKKTIFILNYDENDGYFDHIPPFTAPKPNDPNSGKVSDGIDTAPEYVTMQEEMSKEDFDKNDARESPVGLGYRIPMVIASPWTRGGWVNSEVFDHTSTLQFLEKFLSKKTGKEIKEPNISDWRRTVTGDLTSAFRPYKGEKIILPEFVKRDLFVEKIYNAKFKKLPTDFRALHANEINEVKNNPKSSLLSRQEPGIRNSCALPYQLNADGELSDDKKIFEIIFSAENELFGTKSAGSPFNVYAPGKYASLKDNSKIYQDVKAWSYAVRTGDKLKAQWPLENFENDRYHLRLYGPNGFFREFIGDENDAAVSVKIEYEQMRNSPKKYTGNIVLIFKNLSDERHSIEVVDNSYKNPKQNFELDKLDTKQLVLALQKSFNWYDISVKIEGNNLFEKRFAGRVETGEPGKSDPFMGRV